MFFLVRSDGKKKKKKDIGTGEGPNIAGGGGGGGGTEKGRNPVGLVRGVSRSGYRGDGGQD